MNFLFILSLGIIDRLRGSGLVPKAAAQVVYGLTTAIFLLYPTSNLGSEASFIFLFTILFTAGISLGWGQPLGAYIGNTTPDPKKKESWQFGIYIDEPLLAVILRGFIWGLATAPCIYFKQQLTLIFMISIFLAFPLAATLAREIVRKGYLIGWELHEFIRGVLLGVMIFLIKLVYI